MRSAPSSDSAAKTSASRGWTEHIHEVANASLRRQRRETIFQHRYDPDVPIADVAGVVKDLIQVGKVRHLGLCEMGPDIIPRAYRVQPVTVVQSEYSLMWRESESALFPIIGRTRDQLHA
ncbi:aldo/keto reductase [Burkholderia sp. Bp9017]|uniref:aldo/keto reductase n=1 Tax=unclassified Burkholderia TaxID=2613784 RepID=UPI00390831BB